MSLSDKLYRIFISGGSYLTILKGLRTTVAISLASVILGTLLACLICLLRTRKNAVIRNISAAYIAFLRGTPVLTLLLLLYYGVFARAGLPSALVATFTFALNFSAHVAELLRTSISATEKGQVEAARTLGFSRWEAFRLITLPQTLEIAKPVYQSLIVNLIQWTSVVGYVTITDLTRVINNISSRTMQPFITITIGMFIYLGLSYAIYGIFALMNMKKKGAA